MPKKYIETTSLLLAIREEFKEKLLSEIKDFDYFVSDLVLAEIHNMDEPDREYVARLLNEINPLVLKIQEEDLEFGRKYVYNKVLENKDYPLGVHYLIASKNNAVIVTCAKKLSDLKDGLDRINSYFKLPTSTISLIGYYESETLEKVRASIGRLVETQGEKKLAVNIRESSEFFIREKKLPLVRREKV